MHKANTKEKADLKKICVSLVSDQTIPNTLFIMENKADFDRYYFITTQKMESLSKSDFVIDACALTKNKIMKIMVVEDSLNDIFNKLSTIKVSEDDKCFVNLTGGTKLMTLCVYKHFFENYKSNSSFYYMPIGKNSIEKIHPFDPPKKYIFPIEYRLDLKKYLKAVGLEIDKSSKTLPAENSQIAKKIFDLHIQNKLDHEALWTLRKMVDGHGDDPGKIKISAERRLVNQINIIGKFDNSALLKKEAEYITGGWFEEYVYYKIKKILNIPDNFIATGVFIANNEFDVIFMLGNSLFVIECKTGLKNPFNGKSIISEALYKVAALNKKFGLQTKSYIFTLDMGLRTVKGEIKEFVQNRLNESNVKLADRKIFLDDKLESEFIETMKFSV